MQFALICLLQKINKGVKMKTVLLVTSTLLSLLSSPAFSQEDEVCGITVNNDYASDEINSEEVIRILNTKGFSTEGSIANDLNLRQFVLNAYYRRTIGDFVPKTIVISNIQLIQRDLAENAEKDASRVVFGLQTSESFADFNNTKSSVEKVQKIKSLFLKALNKLPNCSELK